MEYKNKTEKEVDSFTFEIDFDLDLFYVKRITRWVKNKGCSFLGWLTRTPKG